jgi:hypothetical protein
VATARDRLGQSGEARDVVDHQLAREAGVDEQVAVVG